MSSALFKLQGLLVVLLLIQWVAGVAYLAFLKWGFLAGFLAALAAVPTSFLSPLVVWLLFDGVSIAWFYGTLGSLILVGILWWLAKGE